MRYLLWCFCFWLLVGSAVSAQNAKIDSLKKVIETTTTTDTTALRHHLNLCTLYHQAGAYQEAIRTAFSALETAKKINHIPFQAEFYLILYDEYRLTEDAARTYEVLNKGLSLARQSKDGLILLNALIKMGRYFQESGNYPLSLDYFFQARNLANEIKASAWHFCVIHVNIGTVYYKNQELDKAENYYRIGLKKSQETRQDAITGKVIGYLAQIYADRKQYTDAKRLHQESIAYLTKVGDSVAIANNYTNLANIYKVEKDYPLALKFLDRALGMYRYAGFMKEAGQALAVKAKLFHLMNKSEDSRRTASEALTVARPINDLNTMKEAFLSLSLADSVLGNYKSAYEHYKLYTQYKDSLYNEDKAKEFGRIESKYHFEKKAEEAKRKEAELAKMEAEETERRDNLQYLTIFAGIIGLFAGLVFIGKFKIPTRVLDVAIFAGLLIAFEFLLILFDPVFEKYSGGIPFYKLGFNAIVAFAFAPLHGFLEGKLKKRLVKAS